MLTQPNPNGNDWVLNSTGSNFSNNIGSIIFPAVLHTSFSTRITPRVNTFSISTTFMSRGMNNSYLSEFIIFPTLPTSTDRTTLFNSQNSYYNVTN